MTHPAPKNERAVAQELEFFQDCLKKLKNEMSQAVVGQQPIVEGLLMCLLAGGHVLLEGVPGLGKTMMVRALAEALELRFSRIQFTPDLMPADIVGTNMIVEDGSGGRQFEFQPGPIFTNIVLADEINRATPKTQSALLEAMQEATVTVAKNTYALEPPFLVVATQNPLEMEGTYPLPEAQLDRFLFKLIVEFPKQQELKEILNRTTGAAVRELNSVLERKEIIRLQALIREVPVADSITDYTIQILEGTHPDRAMASDLTRRYVRFGASPRGAQAMLLTAKIRAMLEGRFSVSRDDIKSVAHASLRHRVILNFEGEAEGIESDAVLDEVIARVDANQ
jgi:MoxR-like ATPase